MWRRYVIEKFYNIRPLKANLGASEKENSDDSYYILIIKESDIAQLVI